MAHDSDKPRILTTHVGSLPRPEALLSLMQARERGESIDTGKLSALLTEAVRQVVARQVETGIDVVSDGEFSKPSYATYVTERLTGFGEEFHGHAARDLRDYRDFAQHLVDIGGVVPSAGGACCIGAVMTGDQAPLQADLENFSAAVAAAQPKQAFMNAASPGVVTVFQQNRHYANENDYIEAVAAALRPEYEAIVAAGFLLQIDSPDLAMGRHLAFAELSDADFIAIARRNVCALNEALRTIPADRVRMHLCWGNYPGPHHRDIPLDKIIDVVLEAKPKYLLLEGANPRHEHEWNVFRTVELPDDKIIVPGVIDSTSNYIEHPDVVAQRICRYADTVGRERVMAGTDCGFSTFSGYPTVWPEIAWAKLASLAAGAQRASEILW